MKASFTRSINPDLGFKPDWATLDRCRGRSVSFTMLCILDKMD